MNLVDFEPGADPVVNSRLRSIVQEARQPPFKPTAVTYDDVRRDCDARIRRRSWRLSAAVAAACFIGGLLAVGPGSDPREDPERWTRVASSPSRGLGVAEAGDPRVQVGQPANPAGPPASGSADRAASPSAAATDGGRLILGPWVLERDVAGHRMRIARISADVLRFERPGAAPAAAFESGAPVPASGAAAEGRQRTDPNRLARRADAKLRAGDRRGAIRLLERLVAQHPRHGAARAALLDLGRLYTASGNRRSARCAYRRYLALGVGGGVDRDVESALAKLGPGPGCKP